MSPTIGQRAKSDTPTLRNNRLKGISSSRSFKYMFLPTLLLIYLQVCSDHFLNLSLGFFRVTVEKKSPLEMFAVFVLVWCLLLLLKLFWPLLATLLLSAFVGVVVVLVVGVLGVAVVPSINYGWKGPRFHCIYIERHRYSLCHQEWCHITVFAQINWQRCNLYSVCKK